SCLVQHKHFQAPPLHQVDTAENVVSKIPCGRVWEVRAPGGDDISRRYQEKMAARRLAAIWIGFFCHDLGKKLVQFRDSPEQSLRGIEVCAESKNMVVLHRIVRLRNRHKAGDAEGSRDI